MKPTYINAMSEFKDIVHDENNIKGFFGEYRYLSNYHETPIVIGGLVYGSTEAAYQAMKCKDPANRAVFTTLDPKQSKAQGGKVELREDWEDIKDIIMYELNYQKFYYNNELLQRLLDTGEKNIEETNWWGDRYWGVCDGQGLNRLGSILITVRQSIREVQLKLPGRELMKNVCWLK